MRIKVTVHSVASDTHGDGTQTAVFRCEAEMLQHMRTTMAQKDLPPEIEELIAAGQIQKAWDIWEEQERSPLDTFSFSSEDVEFDVPAQNILPNSLESIAAPQMLEGGIPMTAKENDAILAWNQAEGFRVLTYRDGAWRDSINQAGFVIERSIQLLQSKQIAA